MYNIIYYIIYFFRILGFIKNHFHCLDLQATYVCIQLAVNLAKYYISIANMSIRIILYIPSCSYTDMPYILVCIYMYICIIYAYTCILYDIFE